MEQSERIRIAGNPADVKVGSGSLTTTAEPASALGPARSVRRLTIPQALQTRTKTGFRPGVSFAQLRAAFNNALSREAGRGLAFLLAPVAMGGGAGLYYRASVDPSAPWLIAGLAIAVLAVLFTAKHHPHASRFAGLVAALLIGSLSAAFESQRGAILLDSDVTTRISGIVEARDFDAGGRVRYLIRLTGTDDPQIRRPPGRVRLVARMPHQPIPVGGAIAGRARLSSPSGPAMPGGYDFAFRAFVDGIGAHGFFYRAPDAVASLEQPAGVVLGFGPRLRQMREHIAARIRAALPGDSGGIAAALAVSDRRGISPATVEALRATGLAHILAISGLHMALAAGTLYVGLRQVFALVPALVEAWPVKKFAAFGALVTATAYLLISGGSVPTLRAWVMLAVMLIAVIADRPALTLRNVAMAAIVIILLQPSAVVGPGFQMSFAATAALISTYAALAERGRKKPAMSTGGGDSSAPRRWLIFLVKAALGLAITSLVAGLATGLFAAYHFHRVAGNGLLANLMAMPLVTLVVMPSGLVALLMMPFGLDHWPLQLMGLGLEGVIAVARFVDALGGDILVGRIALSATVTAGAGFIVLVFLRSWLRLGGVALLGLGGLLALPPLAPPGPDVLISEGGDLVALAGAGGLASNAARPSNFVFEQWQAALRGKPHLPPVSHPDLLNETIDSGDLLDRLMAAAADQPSRFQCAGRGVCAAVHRQARLLAIDKAELIGAACDRADLVIVAIPVYMRACRSGATLVTARGLRRSGALAITIGQQPPGVANVTAATRLAAAARSKSGSVKPRPVFKIDPALGGVIRPWTTQRYYDWRTRRYDLPAQAMSKDP